jgi:formate-nitrite transporter family protein
VLTTKEEEKPSKPTEHTLEQPKEPYEIMVEQMEAGLKEHHRSNVGLFISSLSAGLEVGFSILVIGIIYTLFKTEVSAGKLYLMMALVAIFS